MDDNDGSSATELRCGVGSYIKLMLWHNKFVLETTVRNRTYSVLLNDGERFSAILCYEEELSVGRGEVAEYCGCVIIMNKE